MPIVIPVAHDFSCPWCWIGLFQARRLQREFGVEIEWRGFELFPESMPWPEPTISPKTPENKPQTPSRLSLLLMAEGVSIPKIDRSSQMRTQNAHQAVEFAKTEGKSDQLVEVIYKAYWERGEDINSVEVLERLAHGVVKNLSGMTEAIESNKFDDQVVNFDQPAYDLGVYNVPTFFIGDARLAEQPYGVIRKAMVASQKPSTETDLYQDIEFPSFIGNRPYVFANMVSTIDGKIITGERDEQVGDLGSPTDHFVMRRLETKADAVMVGSSSLRAAGNQWNPKTEFRIVVSVSGNIPWESSYMLNGKPIVVTTTNATFEPPEGVIVLRSGANEVDWTSALVELKKLGIDVLNLLGGSETNASLLKENLVDELFLTLAPKIKLGSVTPTYAGGEPLAREEVMKFKLLSCVAIGEEVFLRYGR